MGNDGYVCGCLDGVSGCLDGVWMACKDVWGCTCTNCTKMLSNAIKSIYSDIVFFFQYPLTRKNGYVCGCLWVSRAYLGVSGWCLEVSEWCVRVSVSIPNPLANVKLGQNSQILPFLPVPSNA